MSSEFKCTCGNPRLSGVVHRLNAPCYHEDKPPTPLASTAREAAREIREYINGDQYVIEKFVAQLDPTLAAILQKHFQPLLAKVEGEREEAVAALDSAVTRAQNSGNGLYQNIVATMEPHFPKDTRDLEWDVLPSTIGRVMADLAAKEEALRDMITMATQEGWNTSLYLPEYGNVLRRARESFSASRADKGGATAAGTPDELKAAVDALAQACGFPKSDNYVQMLETIGKRERRLTEANNTLRKEVAAFEKLFGLDTPWPAVALYKALVIAESKFREQGRDFDGWEAIQSAAAVAQQRVSDFLKE